MTAAMLAILAALFVPQGGDRVQLGGSGGRVEPEENADAGRNTKSHGNGPGLYGRGEGRESSDELRE